MANLHKAIKDPELREKLTPHFEIGCKRILISNDYYPALAQDHVDLVTDPIAKVSGHAVVGLSLARENRTFSGLPLDAVLRERDVEPRCGLAVIDLASGDMRHWLRIEGVVRELYDVAALRGVRRPSAIGFKTDEVQRVISIEE